MSNDHHVGTEKMFDLWEDLFYGGRKNELGYLDFGDEMHDIFQLFNIFFGSDEGFKGVDDLSIRIDFNNSNLDRDIFLGV